MVSISQAQVSGYIRNQNNQQGLANVSLFFVSTDTKSLSDSNGYFKISIKSLPDTLVVRLLGFEERRIVIKKNEEIFDINLIPTEKVIDEVLIQTGYQSLPKERATGSFVQISQTLIQQSVSSNILERLEGVVNGLHFNKKNGSERFNSYDSPMIRGVSTISANNDPLIVLDNFPYEGNISSINPNDIASITFLKDAAAASIWGARAGNGVIVIQSKRASIGQPLQINIQGNLTHLRRPNIFYSPDFIPAKDFIEMELKMYEKGFYNLTNRTVLSPVIEDKIKGILSNDQIIKRYSNYDYRNQASNYIYRNSLTQRYNTDISAGGSKLTYRLSAGLDNNRAVYIGDQSQRFTLNTTNRFQLGQKINADLGIGFIQENADQNGMRVNDIRIQGLYPYANLIDEEGNYLVIPKDYRMTYVADAPTKGLLDWEYRPLQELHLTDNRTKDTEIRIQAGLQYKLPLNMNVEGRFQYYSNRLLGDDLKQEEGYFVRNLVNRFTQADGSRPIPLGDIYTKSYNGTNGYVGRIQLNYQSDFQSDHQINALVGSEIRDVSTDAYNSQVYGFNNQILTWVSRIDYLTRFNTLPDGTAQIPVPSVALQDKTDRYFSYYSNASYTFGKRYILSASARKDGSNLFGVKVNDRSVPLWSSGIAWNLNNEEFLKNNTVFDELKVRLTYGYAGNIDRSTSAYPLGSYGTDSKTNLRSISIRNPGNPQLRWEKISTLNTGIDFSLKALRMRGSVEYFEKNATDLIGNFPLDPTSGYFINTNYSTRVNYAGLRTRGVDLQINSINTTGRFRWESDLLFNYVSEKVTQYDFGSASTVTYLSTLDRIPRLGYPVNGLYSYPWYGLKPENGNPQVSIDGILSENYTPFVNGLKFEDLIYHGSQIPRFTGSLRNQLHYSNLSFRFNITWKADYYFRANSLSYNNLFSNWSMHKDYMQRWQKKGDEIHTQVPSLPNGLVSNRDVVYLRSEIHVQRGDHIRLQDVQLSYDLTKHLTDKTGSIRNANIFLYARDIGILWRANNKGLDPDRPYVQTIPSVSISLGANLNF